MPSLKTSLGVPCFMFIFLATNWDESVLYILCGRGSLCFGQFGQNSDNIRTKFGQNSDKIRTTFGQNSDKIRTTFGQNSDKTRQIRTKFGKNSDKFRTKFDKIRTNVPFCDDDVIFVGQLSPLWKAYCKLSKKCLGGNMRIWVKYVKG